MFIRIFFSSLFLTFSALLFSQGSIIVVTNTQDAGEGSFRQAVENAANPGDDTIVFEIPFADPGYDSTLGVWTIESKSVYNVPSGTAIFGGNAMATENPMAPAIEIQGDSNAITSGHTGLYLADSVTVHGLSVNQFQYAIRFRGDHVTIENCYLGTDPTGTLAKPNGAGAILVSNGASHAVIQNNLISGNLDTGIRLFGEETSDIVIRNNLVGTNFDGTLSLPNQNNGLVLHVGTNRNQIIGNVISGNNFMGISLLDTGTNNNIFQDNLIGTDITGVTALPNGTFGVAFFNGPSNNIFGPGNRVAFNGNDGVLVDGSDQTETVGNRVTRNSISDNDRLGINNFRGGNGEPSPPSVDSLVANVVYGSGMSGQIIELFFDGSDEGCCFIGSDTVGTMGVFHIRLPDLLPDQLFLTATATDSLGNTSEFSEPFCFGSPQHLFDGVAAFCKGMAVHLTAGVYDSYLWSTGATTEVITVQTPGIYKVTVTDSRGCTGSDSVMVIEYPTPSLAIDTFGTDCTRTVLDAGDFDSYHWSTGDSTPVVIVWSSATYSVMVTDSNDCTAVDSVLVLADPLNLPWVQDLINNPFNPYCNECLTLSQAIWMDSSVIIYDWDAGSCNFTDMGFTTIYNCDGDTIQHCFTSIAGVHCDPEAMIKMEDLENEQLLWQCTPFIFPDCPTDKDSILSLPWLIDTLNEYEELCDLACIGGNSGNFLYKHMVDTNIILELRTTCADVIRRFYDCEGALLYSCTSFSESGSIDCNLDFLPLLDAGELVWKCPATTARKELTDDNLFKVFPTLFRDYLYIESDLEEPGKVVFSDAFGHVIKVKSNCSTREAINTDNWPKGLIYAKMIYQNKAKVIKLLKID